MTLALCLCLVLLAMVAAHREGLSYPWRLWAVLTPPIVLVYIGVRRLLRVRAERGA